MCVDYQVSVDCSVLALGAVVGMRKKFGLLKCLPNGELFFQSKINFILLSPYLYF